MTAKTPFFSVVIPAFNRSHLIRRTLESVAAQTFEGFECIVVDDGSDDAEELRALVESLGDDRFRYVWQRNGGGGAARNTGVEHSVGEFIAFLDSDDEFLPQKLATFHQFLIASNERAAYSKALVNRGISQRPWVRPDRGIRHDEDMGEYLFLSNQFVQTSTIVMHTADVKRIRFNPILRKGQDLDFCVRAQAEGIRFVMLEEPLIIWNDVSEIGRTSRSAGTSGPEAWLEENAHLLTRKAAACYRATVLAYYQPKWKFPAVIIDLAKAILVGLPVKVAVRQWLRFALPRRIYRKVTNIGVRVLGSRMHLQRCE